MDAAVKPQALYNPRNWWFATFFLGPLPAVICYAHNLRVLGEPKKGRGILVAGILFAIGLVVISFLFEPWGFLAALGLHLWATWYAAHVAKAQIPVYDAKVTADPAAGRKKMLPIVLVFVAIQLALLLVLPELAARYLESRYTPVNYGGETFYVPRADKPSTTIPTLAQVVPSIRITWLSEDYPLSAPREGDVPGTEIYTFATGPSSTLSQHWRVIVVPREAMERFDGRCPPGDCMRDLFIYPSLETWENDLRLYESGQRPFVTYRLAEPEIPMFMDRMTHVDGDFGYFGAYVTYADGFRIAFVSPVSMEQSEKRKYDAVVEDIDSIDVD